MMKKLIKQKKGFNDVVIIAVIITIFLTTALLMPFISAAYNVNSDEWNTADYEQKIKDEARDIGTMSSFSVLVDVMSLVFWDFDDSLNLPFWIDGLYTLLAVILIIVIARNIWIGGGG